LSLYIVIVAIVAPIAGLLIALCTKKAEDVVYGKLDKAGRITNIVLIPIYAVLSLFCMGIGFFCNPGYDGFLEFLGWIVALFIPSAPLFCFVGLGLSTALRKKGKSKQSFIIQFIGFASVLLSVSMFFIFYGNLLSYLN
jgi:cytochrome bd-type quinol oxidase subunit 2